MKSKLNLLRRHSGITWQQLADETGISMPTLHRIGYDQVRTIRLEYIDALCTFFRVPIAELFEVEIVALPLTGGWRTKTSDDDTE